MNTQKLRQFIICIITIITIVTSATVKWETWSRDKKQLTVLREISENIKNHLNV